MKRSLCHIRRSIRIFCDDYALDIEDTAQIHCLWTSSLLSRSLSRACEVETSVKDATPSVVVSVRIRKGVRVQRGRLACWEGAASSSMK